MTIPFWPNDTFFAEKPGKMVAEKGDKIGSTFF
jgi:hypothetical protein